MPRSYKPEIKVYRDPTFYQNSLAFATHEEAHRNAEDKFIVWTQAEAFRVAESDEEPNYTYVDGVLKAIPITVVQDGTDETPE